MKLAPSDFHDQPDRLGGRHAPANTRFPAQIIDKGNQAALIGVQADADPGGSGRNSHPDQAMFLEPAQAGYPGPVLAHPGIIVKSGQDGVLDRGQVSDQAAVRSRSEPRPCRARP